jgi:hypothetical protein
VRSEKLRKQLLRVGVKPVNPQFHDELIALCALFFAGELTDEEWALLQVHLAYCDSCRERFEEYQRQSLDVINPCISHRTSGHYAGDRTAVRPIEGIAQELGIGCSDRDKNDIPRTKRA